MAVSWVGCGRSRAAGTGCRLGRRYEYDYDTNGGDYDDTLNFTKHEARNRLFSALLFSLLSVVLWESVACGELLNAPRGARVGSVGGQFAGEAPLNAAVAAVQRELLDSGRVAFGRGEFSLRELGNISSGLERELVVTRIGKQRYLNLVGSHGGTFSLEAGEKLILHTHPGQGYWGLQRSAFGTDFGGLPIGVSRSAVVNESGWWRIYRSDGTLSELYGTRVRQ